MPIYTMAVTANSDVLAYFLDSTFCLCLPRKLRLLRSKTQRIKAAAVNTLIVDGMRNGWLKIMPSISRKEKGSRLRKIETIVMATGRMICSKDPERRFFLHLK